MNKLISEIDRLKYPNQLWVVLIVGAMMLAAFGTSIFSFGYSIDGYLMCAAPSDYWSGFAKSNIANGRFGRALIYAVLHFFAVDDCFSPTLYGVLSISINLASLLLVLRMWNLSSILGGAMIGGLFLVHPYHAEMYSFREGGVYFSGSLFLALLAVKMLTESDSVKFRKIYAIALLVSSLSIYQLSINYALIALVFSICERVINDPNIENGIHDWRRTFKDVVSMFTVALASIVVYVVVNKIVLATSGQVALERTHLMAVTAIPRRLAELPSTFHWILFSNQEILPASEKKILFLIPLIALLSVVFFYVKKKGELVQPFFIFGIVALTLLTCLLLVLGIQLPLQALTRESRTISAISLFLAGSLMIVIKTQPMFFRRWLAKGLPILFVIFAGNANHALTDQLRVNARDQAKANRIFSALEGHPAYSTLNKLVVIGGSWNYSATIYTAEGDLNASAFSAAWARTALIEEVSGHRFEWVQPDEYASAQNFCDSAPKWPDRNSYSIRNGLGVVCLGDGVNP
ncbi:MAG: glucosyltransferase domain-containing protein [Burkholderiaceae bacterium]|nr:glucosyltransferase domain-containing protein [Burkholderiaceae bacterium]